MNGELELAVYSSRGSRKLSRNQSRALSLLFPSILILMFFAGNPARSKENLLSDASPPPPPAQAATVSTSQPELNLNQALAKALTDNTNLQMAEQAVEIALASGKSALAGFRPDLSMDYTYTRLAAVPKETIPGLGTFPLATADTFSLGLTFKYMLYNGGQNLAIDRAATAQVNAAGYRLDEAKMLINVGVTTAYTSVLEAQAALEASKTSLDNVNEVLRVSQANFDAGFLPQSDLLSVEVAQAQGLQAVSQAEQNLELARSALALTVGSDIRERWDLAPVAYPESEIPLTLDNLWDYAMAQRPELKELKSQRDALIAQMDATRTATHPRISFEAGFSQSAPTPILQGNGGLGGGSNLSGTVGIFWDFDDFGKTDAMLDPLRRQLDLMNIQEISLRDQVRQEVETSLLSVKTQLGNLAVMRKAVEQAQEAYRVAYRRQQEGLGITLEVLTAEATLAQTTLGLTHGLYEYYRNLAQLAQTVGMSTDDLVALIVANKEGAAKQ